MTHDYLKHDFVESFNALRDEVFETAKEKGWWDAEDKVTDLTSEIAGIVETHVHGIGRGVSLDKKTIFNKVRGILDPICKRNDAEQIALIHTELSEAVEGLREGNPPDDKIPEFSSVEAEYADVIIRIMDHSRKNGWRVAEAVLAKIAYNKTRPKFHGRKAF